MSDMIKTGVDWLANQMSAFASQTVTYSRGNDSVIINATFGSTDLSIADDYGSSIAGKVVDLIVTAANLVLDGKEIKPEIGDKIELADGSKTTIYEVLDLAGDGCYRFSDSYGISLRIHTKIITVS